MDEAVFTFFRDFLMRESGQVLTEAKSYLLEHRLKPIATRHGIDGGVDGIHRALTAISPPPGLVEDVVHAMTTNESSFFRDVRPFDLFETVLLPQLLATRGTMRRIRIWSAACSTGQEPYSLAMILRDHAEKLAGWDVKIIATDISSSVLERARAGRYSQFEVQRGMPVTRLVKYFKQDGDSWHVHDDLKKMVVFDSFNLLHDPAPLGMFDVVFCRNVLIYFDNETKARVLGNIRKVTSSDGALFLGGSETVMGISEDFATHADHQGLYVPTSSTFGQSMGPSTIQAGSSA